ncbi:hypothetical protein KJA13_03905 [Patescibacteria group bacterium]|nr:hypothetical protein [Patescibacteria group bacterium]
MKKVRKMKKTRNMWIKIAKVLKVSGLIMFSIIWVVSLAFFFLIVAIFRIPIEDPAAWAVRDARKWRRMKVTAGIDPTYDRYGRPREP